MRSLLYRFFALTLLLFLPALAFGVPATFDISWNVASPIDAGVAIPVTITAKQSLGGPVDTSYSGTLNFTSSYNPITPSASGVFSNGVWVGQIKFFQAANSIRFDCTDQSGASGTAYVNIKAGSFDRLLMIVPGQTYLPGYAQGVSPTGNINLFEGTYYNVTICGVDTYSNILSTFTDQVEIAASSAYLISPSSIQNAVAGRAYYHLIFSQLGIVPVNYYRTAAPGTQWTQTIYVENNNYGYLHLLVPSTPALAGTYFAVTATVSNKLNDPFSFTNKADNWQFQIQRFMMGTANPATGTWLDQDNFVMSGSLIYLFYKYSKAEGIYIKTQTKSESGITIEGKQSEVFTIVPNEPHALEVLPAVTELQSGKNTTIQAVVKDAYENRSPSSQYGYQVNFQILNNGGGHFSNNQALYSAATNSQAEASAVYTAGNQNEIVQIRVWVDNYVSVEATQNLTVSVAPPDPGAVLNFPNPFNPSLGQKTSFNYYLQAQSDLTITIHDAFGRLVLKREFDAATTDPQGANAVKAGGAYWNWDGKNAEGRFVANGIYYLRIVAKQGTAKQEFKRRVGVLK